MTSLDEQAAALRAMLAARDTWRAARADFVAAFKEAREAGVSDETVANSLVADSIAHGELDTFAALARDLRAAATWWDDEAAPAGPGGGYCTKATP
jgi:hypothetical protein